MKFTNNLKMKDLFQNPKCVGIIPQIETKSLNKKPSPSEIDKSIKSYLEGVFNSKFSGSHMKVNGKKKEVLSQVQNLKWILEAIYNNYDSIKKNLLKNTPVYTPFKSVSEIEKINNFKQKYNTLNAILDNLNYNPDFESENSVRVFHTNMNFIQRRNMWLRKVGYKGVKSYAKN